MAADRSLTKARLQREALENQVKALKEQLQKGTDELGDLKKKNAELNDLLEAYEKSRKAEYEEMQAQHDRLVTVMKAMAVAIGPDKVNSALVEQGSPTPLQLEFLGGENYPLMQEGGAAENQM